MEQNKATFIVDNYVEVQGVADLGLVTAWLMCRSMLFVVEPWPAGRFRVYSRKDKKNELIEAIKIFGGKYEKLETDQWITIQ